MYRSSCRVPITSYHINETNCVDSFLKNTQVSKLMKIRHVVAELFHMGGRTNGRTDGQTDRQRLGRAET
jgi:hypothetical protein